MVGTMLAVGACVACVGALAQATSTRFRRSRALRRGKVRRALVGDATGDYNLAPIVNDAQVAEAMRRAVAFGISSRDSAGLVLFVLEDVFPFSHSGLPIRWRSRPQLRSQDLALLHERVRRSVMAQAREVFGG